MFTNTQCRDLLKSIKTIASEPYDQWDKEADRRYVYALGLIAGVADEALHAVSADKPANFLRNIREWSAK